MGHADRFAIHNQMRRALDESAEPLGQLDRVVDRLRRLGVPDDDARKRVSIVTGEIDEWRREISQLRAQL